jgi:hypothetical protein
MDEGEPAPSVDYRLALPPLDYPFGRRVRVVRPKTCRAAERNAVPPITRSRSLIHTSSGRQAEPPAELYPAPPRSLSFE